MKDPALWARLRESPAQPIGERPIDQWLSDELAFSRRKVLLIAEEDRRATYLRAVANRPLIMPPLMEGIQKARAEAERNMQALEHSDARGPSDQLSSGIATASYPETLALYRSEFGKPLSRKVWPHPIALKVGYGIGTIFGVCVVVSFTAGVSGFLLDIPALERLAAFCLFPCVFGTIWISILGPWGILVTKADGG